MEKLFFLLKRVMLELIEFKIKLYTRYYCIINRIKYNNTWRFIGKPYILQPHFWHKTKKKQLQIGNNFLAISKFSKNSIGLIQPVLINVSHPGSEILIGNNVGISGATIKALTKIVIGDNVLIGSGVLIVDNDSHSLLFEDREDISKISAKPITIENDVFIGARAIILKGVTIGKGAVIGAGAVVTTNIPEYAVAAGNPAKVLKILK